MNNAHAYPGLVRSTVGHAAPWRTPTIWSGRTRLLMLDVHSPTAPTKPPVAHLLTEREEHYEYNEQGSVSSANIRIWYERLSSARRHHGPHRNLCFEGSYHAWCDANGCVSLTSTTLGHGAVYLDLKDLEGHRIGTYLMNEIVSWAKQWPKAEVHPVQLLAPQAIDTTNKLRRNRFYTQFGLSFDFEDDAACAGLSHPITVEQLNLVDTWQRNIQAHSLDHALLAALDSAENATLRIGTLQAEYNQFRTANARHRILWGRVLAVVSVAFVLAVLATASILRRFDSGPTEHPQPTNSARLR